MLDDDDRALAGQADGALSLVDVSSTAAPRLLGSVTLDSPAYGVALQDTSAPVATMSGGQRQGIAVSRAVTWASKVVFMDEPTAALGVVQTRNVLDLIGRVRDQGLSVVLISHNMPEVFEVADRIEVLRLGTRVARFRRGEVSMEDVVGAMTGAITHDGEAA